MHLLIERFKALGDETRFKIFLLLSEQRICVKGLAKKLKVSESAVSQHIKVLKQAGLLKGEKMGYYMHYNVQKDVLKELESIIGELSKDTVDLAETKAELGVENFDCTAVCKKSDGGC